tara:strand:- start:360 stop:923 length:564 start_codon:yes stop_codon:yes gene_type:complete
MQWMLLLTLIGAALVAYMGFALGDRKRRRAAGEGGPRPSRSIGDALELSEARLGEALVFFLGEDEASVAVADAIASDPRVLAHLRAPKLAHVILRSEREGREILELLYEKYDGEPLPALPAGLLLLADGKKRAGGSIKGDLATEIDRWLRRAPPPASPDDGKTDAPVTKPEGGSSPPAPTSGGPEAI